jgi:hypothetical protein
MKADADHLRLQSRQAAHHRDHGRLRVDDARLQDLFHHILGEGVFPRTGTVVAIAAEVVALGEEAQTVAIVESHTHHQTPLDLGPLRAASEEGQNLEAHHHRLDHDIAVDEIHLLDPGPVLLRFPDFMIGRQSVGVGAHTHQGEMIQT